MLRTLFISGFAILGLIAALLWLWPPAPEEPPAFCQDCNVVLILADTLRADHLGSYGYGRDTSPFIDQLARTSIQFLNVRSQASCTFPSVNSILTSQPTFRFLDPKTRPAIPPTIRSLPEILGQHGYATAAVSASPIVRKTPSDHNPVGGFGRGFDTFDEACHWRESTCVTERTRRQLGTLSEPFFLYAHYMDPHDPYQPLRQFRSRFAAPYAGEHDFVQNGDPNPIEKLIREKQVEATLAPEDFDHLVDLYDEEILSLDFGLSQLFAILEEKGLLDRTIFVLASDHGESFYEHGTVKHCYTVYDTETRVPLLMRLPPAVVPVPAVRKSPVQNLDILPTLLDYLGLPMDGLALAGRSLRPVIETDQPHLPAFSSAGPWRSVNDERYKLIHHLGKKDFALYDLETDPAERDDRLTEKRREFRLLQEKLLEWEREVEGGDADERLKRAQEIEDELRSLGYLG